MTPNSKSVPNPQALKQTIRELKEVVANAKGEDHEASRLVRQMEERVLEIERKVKNTRTAPESTIQPTVRPAQLPA